MTTQSLLYNKNMQVSRGNRENYPRSDLHPVNGGHGQTRLPLDLISFGGEGSGNLLVGKKGDSPGVLSQKVESQKKPLLDNSKQSNIELSNAETVKVLEKADLLTKGQETTIVDKGVENDTGVSKKTIEKNQSEGLACQKRVCEDIARQDLIDELRSRGFYKEAEKLERCHTQLVFWRCNTCGAVKIGGNSCNSRVCPTCGYLMKRRLVKQYQNALSHLPKCYQVKLKLLTLTLQNVEELSFDTVGNPNIFKESREAFNRFQRRKVVSKVLHGGIYNIEVTNKGQGWNVHIHALVSMDYLEVACPGMKACKNREDEKEFEKNHCQGCPNKCLRRLWQESSGSTIVDIRKVKDAHKAVFEVVGYLAKPVPLADPKLLVDWWLAMRKKPLIKTFGCFRGLDREGAKEICPFCGGSEFDSHLDFKVIDQRTDRQRSPPVDLAFLQEPIWVRPGYLIVKETSRGWFETELILRDDNHVVGACFE